MEREGSADVRAHPFPSTLGLAKVEGKLLIYIPSLHAFVTTNDCVQCFTCRVLFFYITATNKQPNDTLPKRLDA